MSAIPSSLGELQLIAVVQHQASSQVPVIYTQTLTPDLKPNNQRVSDQVGFDCLVILGNASHLGCLEQPNPLSQPLGHLMQGSPIHKVHRITHFSCLEAGIECL